AVEQSSQNPVYYVQYAHARLCSILNNLSAQGVEYRSVAEGDLDVLREPAEREIIRHLATLESEIVAAAKQYDPSRITRFAVELATLFHKYYNSCRVHVEDEAVMYARLFLCVQVRQVLRNVLDLLKIDAPDVM
ncbi:MAG: arginine--tRNA ligase, partial [Clostridia bacterium]|nr:arginine--tRNA ligase [Clostridia bacterium]